MAEAPSLPRWDMTSIYPGLNSSEFVAAHDALIAGLTGLGELLDAHAVGRGESVPLDDGTVAAVEAVIRRYNEVLETARPLEWYVQCLVAVNADDAPARAALSQLQQEKTRLMQLASRFTAWVGSLDLEALVERSAIVAEHAFALGHARILAAHQMSAAEEDLAAELGPSGAAAWFRLRDDIEAGLTARLEMDGESRELPITEVQNLGLHPDRSLRQRGHEAQVSAWQSVTVPLAAALNGVKGETTTLTRRRGWADPLDVALLTSRIDRDTLDALHTAIREAFPDYRRYLRSKARALGLPLLADFDRFAPVGTGRPWPFAEAADFIIECFTAHALPLGALAAQAIAERWIDAEPRAGKGGGGFCVPVGRGRSRILLNYAPSLVWASALAHELGHAYHTAVLARFRRTALQRPSPSPMTLAETASTFCEVLFQRAALARADAPEQVAILDGWLQTVSLNVFETLAGFNFERQLFAARRRRELSADELSELALEAQREVVGDAVEPATLPPFVWASAPHFFMTDLWYYNFPYAFGLLFGLGLYTRYEEDPEGFRAGFDLLLSRTGMAGASELAADFGIDVRSPAFWRASLDQVRNDVDRFEAAVPSVSASGAA